MTKLFCRDKTDGKLFFAQELLWTLNSGNFDTCLAVNEKYEKEYAGFLKHFNNIKRHDCGNKKDDYLQIDIIGSVDRVKENILTYPIIKKPEAQKYNEMRRANSRQTLLAPLLKPISESPFIYGDVRWLKDFLQRLSSQNDLKSRKFLISAGPTREFFDPVRFLTNLSTGKMGIALARAAFMRGAEVTLVLGPTAETAPDFLNIIKVQSAAEMADAVISNFDKSDVYIGAAAVADYTPVKRENHKIKKSGDGLSADFKKTTDILASLKERKKRQLLIGFSVETENVYGNSLKKLQKKGLDLIVVNNPKVAGAAFAADTNKVTIIKKDGMMKELPLLSKLEVSHIILDDILDLLKNSD